MDLEEITEFLVRRKESRSGKGAATKSKDLDAEWVPSRSSQRHR